MRLAFLDDDRVACARLAGALRACGHNCFEFYTGVALRRALQRESFDLLILDWAVPDLSGVDLLAWVRSTLPAPPPVLMLAGRNAGGEVIGGPETGADDFIVEPVDVAVLKARVEALLLGKFGNIGARRVETFGHQVFDPVLKTVSVRGEPVEVTAKQYGLALQLFRNLNRTLSRAHLMEAVWGHNPDTPSRTLDAHVSQIRNRLKLRPENGLRLASVYSFGYRLETLDAMTMSGSGDWRESAGERAGADSP